MFTYFDQIIILLELYLRENLKEERKVVHMKTFLAALFMIRKSWKGGT